MSKLTAYDKFLQQALKYGFSLFGLPKTGQTTSYEDYDDGFYKKGYNGRGVRFSDNNDGTITDNATGLIWAKDGNGAGCNNGGQLAWTAALTWAYNLDFAGHEDWRLPNVFELYSICLLDAGITAPYVNHTYFPNTVSSYYWSATTYPAITSGALYVAFTSGNVRRTDKTNSYYVRAVRGGKN